MTMMGLIIGLLIILYIVQISAQKEVLDIVLDLRISNLKEKLTEKGKALSDNIARQAVTDISENYLPNTVRLVNKAVEDDKAVKSYIIIADKNKVVHAHTMNPELETQVIEGPEVDFALSQTTPAVNEFQKDGIPYMEFVVPLIINDEPWGSLRLGYALEMLNLEIERSRGEVSELTQSMETRTYLLTVLFIIIGAVIVIVESKTLTKPLISLTKSAQELAKGNFEAAKDLHIHSNDEFGLLAAHFVEMSDNLKSSYEKLEDYSHTLENKVEERTKELGALMADVKVMNEKLGNVVEKMTDIGMALSSEKDFNKLSELIVSHVCELTHADAGTLYLLENNVLNFLIIQNDTLNIRMGGKSGDKIPFPPVELNESNVSAYVALKDKTVNIPDVYDSELFDFTGPKKFDKSSGYRSKSMLVVPMKNDKNEIVGVIQLLNAKAPDTDEIIPFSEDIVGLAESIASQAAVAVSNVKLMGDREKLFEEVLNLKNYDESILECLSNGVVSLDAENNIVKCNGAALKILDTTEDELIGKNAIDYFSTANKWINTSILRVSKSGEQDINMDVELSLDDDQHSQVNLTTAPLVSVKKEHIGSLLVLEDITSEKRLKGTLARYMTKEVSERLLESGEEILGGQIQEAAVLFSDIRNFTSLSERLGARETVAMLNEYFTIMVDIIFDNNGILDKYIGDAMMAAFGIPFGGDDDTDRSVTAAIEMMCALKEFNQKRVHENKDAIKMGIGINTDEVLSGNIGSLKRMDYTMIGDGVNLAARLEGATKHYNTDILISDHSYRKLNNHFLCRELDRIKVKGKNEPVGIYEVLDFHDHESFPHMQDCIDLFQQGLASYRRQDWKQAIKHFKKGQSLNGDDSLQKMYIERCQHFAANPPEASWDGVWIMQTK